MPDTTVETFMYIIFSAYSLSFHFLLPSSSTLSWFSVLVSPGLIFVHRLSSTFPTDFWGGFFPCCPHLPLKLDMSDIRSILLYFFTYIYVIPAAILYHIRKYVLNNYHRKYYSLFQVTLNIEIILYTSNPIKLYF